MSNCSFPYRYEQQRDTADGGTRLSDVPTIRLSGPDLRRHAEDVGHDAREPAHVWIPVHLLRRLLQRHGVQLQAGGAALQWISHSAWPRLYAPSSVHCVIPYWHPPVSQNIPPRSYLARMNNQWNRMKKNKNESVLEFSVQSATQVCFALDRSHTCLQRLDQVPERPRLISINAQ